MRQLLFVLTALVAAVVGLASGAGATTTTLTQKQVVITIVITPPPSAYHQSGPPLAPFFADRIAALFGPVAAPAPPAAARFADDKGAARPVIVAAATQGNVPVAINVKTDPTGQYLHIVQNQTTLNAGYGTNTFTCPYSVYGYWTAGWHVNDWIYGTATSGTGPWPGYNYPTTSNLAWKAEGVTTTFTAFSNSGSPGQTTFTGPTGASKTVCIDLQLTVPTTVAPGTYQVPINYQMIVS
jgi:hypothetical protein